MAEAIESVMLAGNGLLRWPGNERRVHYKMTVGFDSVVSAIHLTPPDVDVLRRPSRHSGLSLCTAEGRRLALNVAPNGHVTPDGPLEKSLDGQDWWVDTTPWLPFETPNRLLLCMRRGPVQIFESHATEEEARRSYKTWKTLVDAAEIRPAFGRPIRLAKEMSKGASA
jgi:hypothetical protein